MSMTHKLLFFFLKKKEQRNKSHTSRNALELNLHLLIKLQDSRSFPEGQKVRTSTLEYVCVHTEDTRTNKRLQRCHRDNTCECAREWFVIVLLRTKESNPIDFSLLCSLDDDYSSTDMYWKRRIKKDYLRKRNVSIELRSILPNECERWWNQAH